ncbi:MAG TPA: CARDB domain-containing protein, partial [bacterium]|nr:CARDB domain-containing protein [bacterium]
MLSTLNSKKALLVFVAFLFAFGNLLPALAITSGESTLPRISYWPGKVNQHTENGVWKTDPDGVSGSTTSWTADNILTYCKKWYPNTASVVSDGTISTIDWKAAGNTGSYSSIRPVYRCVQPVSAPDLTFSGFGTNGPDANNNNTVLLVPSIKNIGTAPFAGNLTVSVDISKNNVLITNESFVRNIGLDINMGNFTTYRTQYSFVDSGTYTIKLTLQNVSGETNTSNNTTSAEVTVAGTANYAGKLIKGDSDSNLFYLGTDNKKYVIPSLTGYDAYKNAVLDSWGLVAENAIIISQSQLSSYPIGGNMTIKANTYKLKLENRAEIYNVEYDNYIKQVDSVANHPAGWNDFIIVPDPFFVNYKIVETTTKPDLVPYKLEIKNLTHPSNDQWLMYDSLEITIGFKNTGTTNSAPFLYTLYEGNSTSGHRGEWQGLGAGESSEYKFISAYDKNSTTAQSLVYNLMVDSDNNVVESDENNNTLTKTITVTGTAYYWSLGGWSACVNGSQTRTVICRDNYYFDAVADIYCASEKPVSTQSCGSSKPDLIITNIEISGTPKAGDRYLGGVVTIKNQGNIKAEFRTENFINGALKPYELLNVTLNDTMHTIVAVSGIGALISGDTSQVSIINPGESKKYIFSTLQDYGIFTRSDFLGTSGYKSLYFTVDPGNEVAESNETNNSLTKTVYIGSVTTANPDLMFTSSEITVDKALILPGDTVTFAVDAKNNSTIAIPAGAYLKWYLAGNEYSNCNSRLPALSAGWTSGMACTMSNFENITGDMRTTIETYRAEARFLRALSYYH